MTKKTYAIKRFGVNFVIGFNMERYMQVDSNSQNVVEIPPILQEFQEMVQKATDDVSRKTIEIVKGIFNGSVDKEELKKQFSAAQKEELTMLEGSVNGIFEDQATDLYFELMEQNRGQKEIVVFMNHHELVRASISHSQIPHIKAVSEYLKSHKEVCDLIFDTSEPL